MIKEKLYTTHCMKCFKPLGLAIGFKPKEEVYCLKCAKVVLKEMEDSTKKHKEKSK